MSGRRSGWALRSRLIAGLLAFLAVSIPWGHADGQAAVPVISARTYTSGSAKVTMTGAIQMDEEIAINKPASFGDGEMTWLQFGVSGAATPNALITVSTQEVGLTLGKGKQTATIGAEECTGKMDVTATLVSGQYTCKGVTSYDSGTGKMGKVDIVVRFTAKT